MVIEVSRAAALHDTVMELTKHFHDQIHEIDSQISQLQQQRSVILAVAAAELKRAPELKEAAGDQHHALVQSLFGH
jgi:hypothetical protein